MTQVSFTPASGAHSSAMTPGPTPPPDQPLFVAGSIFAALNALLRQRALVLGFALVLAILAGSWAFFRARVYSSASSFMPEGRQSAAGGLAAQLGLVLPGSGGTESPQFYADL